MIRFAIMKKVFEAGGVEVNDLQMLGFLILVNSGYLSPKPVSFADSLSQRHDREWGHPWEANNNAVTGYIRGIGTREFWEKPVDSILVGGFGLVLLGGSNMLWGLGGPIGPVVAYAAWEYYRINQ